MHANVAIGSVHFFFHRGLAHYRTSTIKYINGKVYQRKYFVQIIISHTGTTCNYFQKKNEREISHNTLKKFKFCMLKAKKIRCLIQRSMSLIMDLKLGVIHFSSMKFSFLLPKNSELDAHQSRCRMSNRLYVRN